MTTGERIFDKYEVVKRLAFGGMGEVFLARQTGVAGFDRLVILKSLLPHLAEDDHLVDEFLNEARLAATLNHPNIVSIYEVGRWRDVYFIAMEYIPGEDLGRLRRMAKEQHKKIPLRAAVRVMRDAAQALHHAHNAVDVNGRPLCIVHRDVTPRNLMVRKDGVTKVVDFGIAKAADKASRTSTGAIKGTVAYMSPEQAFSHPVDARSDQFSLGVVLWELCTGKRLFVGGDPVHVLEAVRKMEIPPPSKVAPKLPATLDRVVGRMLERDADRRFESCAHVAEALSRLLGDYSGPKGQERVAAFVLDVAGDQIDERSRDLTPRTSSLGSGLEALVSGDTAPSEGSSLSHTTSKTATGIKTPAARRPMMRGVLAGAAMGGAVLVAAAVGFFAAGQRGDPDPTPPLVAAPPDVPEPAPPVDHEATPSGDEASSPVTPRAEDTRGEDTPAPGSREASPGRRSKLQRPSRPPERPTPSPPEETSAAALEEPRPASKSAHLTLRTRPWTRVIIDGEDRGATPLFRVKLAAGKHLLHLVNEDAGIDVWKEVRAEPGRDMRFDWDLAGKDAGGKK